MSFLEEEMKKSGRNIDKCIKENKIIADTQIETAMEAIYNVVDKLTNAVKQLQDQVREQKQVSEWVKKEYNLRPVQKVR